MSLYLQALIAMGLGLAVGIALGPKAAGVGVISKYVVELIKLVATPLLFFAILDALLNAEFKGKGVAYLFLVCGLNSIFAISIALILSNFFRAGVYLPVPPLSAKHLAETGEWLNGLQQALSSNQKISLFSGTTAAIFLSLGVGFLLFGIRLIPHPLAKRIFSKSQELVARGLTLLFKAIHWIVILIPLAVFASVAKGIGLYGLSLVHGLAAYFLLCLGGMVIHIALVYQGWIKLIVKHPLKLFWKEAKEPVVYSFGVNSSLATLPVTLTALRNLRVRDASARLAACVGTNLNNDGILLYEVVAALFMIQAYGFDLGLSQQLVIALICLVATVGVAGVPEAGMISLTLVMAAISLPVESLALLISVDWVLGRCRSVTNVLGDMTGAMVIDHHTKDT